MSNEMWKVTFSVHRQRKNRSPRFEDFVLEISPEEYVLDGIEKIWAFHDRSLNFRHACHHTTCGACGMVVNGVEKLTCVTKIKDTTHNGGTIRVEPMRNFPVLSDLVVDMTPLQARLEMVKAKTIATLAEAPLTEGVHRATDSSGDGDLLRLIDCIECGLCISACPVAATDHNYLGPAILAAIQLRGLNEAAELLDFADTASGVWRCHSAYECTEACPSFVEPAWRIMDLRSQVVGLRFKNLFSSS
jgi:succinate dehydrogenase / fumarate reductase iron-sulfur subunit